MNFQSLSTFIFAASLADATIHTKISSSGRWIGVYNDENDARNRQPYRWVDANNYCASQYGTSLASYHNSEDELEVSQTRFDYSKAAWIGLNDLRSESGGEGNGGIRDGWRWTDGSCYNFEINWNSGQPDNRGNNWNNNGEDFAHFIGNNDALNDGSRRLRLDSFICNYMTFEQGTGTGGGESGHDSDHSSDNIVVSSVDDTVELSSDEADDYCNEFFGSDLEEIGRTQFECGPKYCRRRNAATPAPTGPPTWVTPCLESPCDCSMDDYCDVCHSGQGCSQCIGRNGEYFKINNNYPCVNCKEVFGDGCMFCQNGNGCGQCDHENGYNRVKDEQEGLYYCQLKDVSSINSYDNGILFGQPPKQKKNHCSIFGDGCLECGKRKGCSKCDSKNGWTMVTSGDGKVTYCEQNTDLPFSDNLDVNVVSGSNDAIGDNISYSYSYSFMIMAFIGGILCSYMLYIVYKNIAKCCVKTNEKLVNNTEFQTLL